MSLRRLVPALLAIALPALAPAAEFEEIRHLLGRAGFGGTSEEVERLLPLDYEAAVQSLLDGARATPLGDPPAWVDEPPPSRKETKGLDEDARRKLEAQRRERAQELKAWWYAEMIRTDSPLTERMTLFWHNHFTSSLEKVKVPTLVFRQNLLLREHALGSFKALLHAVAKDPAMVIYLDNQGNRKGNPNENFARELLELFTLGEGHYAERDVKEAARAFTGWQVDRGNGRFRFNRRQHDDGEKSFLGRTGDLGGEDIVDVLLAQPRTAEFIVGKLWREFISDASDPAEVKRLAAVFRDGGYEIKPLLKALFCSPAFRDPTCRGTMIKSPVDLLVGTVRMFHVPVKDAAILARAGRQLGQDLFDPPNVKGWPGGEAWITSSTLLGRRQVLERALRGREMEGMEAGMQTMKPEEARRLLLPLPPLEPPPEGTEPSVATLVMDPVYQLK